MPAVWLGFEVEVCGVRGDPFLIVDVEAHVFELARHSLVRDVPLIHICDSRLV